MLVVQSMHSRIGRCCSLPEPYLLEQSGRPNLGRRDAQTVICWPVKGHLSQVQSGHGIDPPPARSRHRAKIARRDLCGGGWVTGRPTAIPAQRLLGASFLSGGCQGMLRVCLENVRCSRPCYGFCRLTRPAQ